MDKGADEADLWVSIHYWYKKGSKSNKKIHQPVSMLELHV